MTINILPGMLNSITCFIPKHHNGSTYLHMNLFYSAPNKTCHEIASAVRVIKTKYTLNLLFPLNLHPIMSFLITESIPKG